LSCYNSLLQLIVEGARPKSKLAQVNEHLRMKNLDLCRLFQSNEGDCKTEDSRCHCFPNYLKIYLASGVPTLPAFSETVEENRQSRR